MFPGSFIHGIEANIEQDIEQSRIIFAIKILDPSCKRFCRWCVSNYPMTCTCTAFPTTRITTQSHRKPHPPVGIKAPLAHTSPLDIPGEAKKLADESNFEVKGYRFGAAPEQGRPPRIVKIALVQNAIVRPTTDPVEDQVCVCVCARVRMCAYACVYVCVCVVQRCGMQLANQAVP